MTDRKTVLKFAHLGRGRPRSGRHREILDEQKRVFEAHIAEIRPSSRAWMVRETGESTSPLTVAGELAQPLGQRLIGVEGLVLVAQGRPGWSDPSLPPPGGSAGKLSPCATP